MFSQVPEINLQNISKSMLHDDTECKQRIDTGKQNMIMILFYSGPGGKRWASDGGSALQEEWWASKQAKSRSVENKREKSSDK